MEIRTGHLERLLWGRTTPARACLLVPLAVFAAATLAALIADFLPHANLSLVFVVAVLLVAGKTGMVAALVTAVVSFLAYNFFFTAPAQTLAVDSGDDLATLAAFLIAATLVASLGARMRRFVLAADAQAVRAESLQAFSMQLAVASDAAAVAEVLIATVRATTGVTAEVLWLGAAPGAIASNDAKPGAVPAGHDDVVLGTSAHLFGILRIPAQGPETLVQVRALCAQSAIVLERTRLDEALEAARVDAETERLRSALLSSVSHDLRTPLVSILGAATSLRELGDTLAPGARRELQEMIEGEAERLNRYIQNLLDMTRLGQGALTLVRDWTDPDDIVASALARLARETRAVDLVLDLAPRLPLVDVHAALIEQALVNVLENAVRHSPPGGRVTLGGRSDRSSLVLSVSDEGPGVPPAERERIFESFYSVRRGAGESEGSGLGLAIAQGFIGAHGGTIAVENGPGGRGATFVITLPLPSSRAQDTDS
ncbi:MAG: DUF4118 domain-containing protein [Gammaproteobacteria bacterium]